jgi:hypothetical protein
MKTTYHKHRSLCRHSVLFALVGIFAVPSVSTATTSVSDVPTPIAADDDDGDCEQATIALEIDVATGNVYIVDGTGGLTLTDNDINVYFGSRTSVLIDLQYSSSEWEVEITPDVGPTQVRQTRGGALRYWINDQPTQYVFSSTDLSGMSTMMDMTPVVPDIIIRPKKNCPPPT